MDKNRFIGLQRIFAECALDNRLFVLDMMSDEPLTVVQMRQCLKESGVVKPYGVVKRYLKSLEEVGLVQEDLKRFSLSNLGIYMIRCSDSMLQNKGALDTHLEFLEKFTISPFPMRFMHRLSELNHAERVTDSFSFISTFMEAIGDSRESINLVADKVSIQFFEHITSRVVDGVVYRGINGGANTTFGNGTTTIAPTLLGSHNITIWAKDASGNLGSDTEYFTVQDTTSPAIAFVGLTPEDNANLSVTSITINVSHIELYPDTLVLNWNGANESQSYPGGYTEITKNVSEGQYTYYVWANDTSGNSNQTETRVVTIDTTLPNITYTNLTPSNGASLSSSTTNVTINVTLSETPDECTLTWKNVNESMDKYGSGSNSYCEKTKNVSAGSYTFKVWANDSSGNLGNETKRTFSVKSAPAPPSSSSGGGGGATSFEAWIKNVLAGETFELDINDEDIPYIKGLSLTAKQDIYSSKLSITDLDKKPWYSMEEPDAIVNRYFKVSYDKKNYVESASFKVSVNKSWLKANDIDPSKFSVYRYTNSWEELDTKILKEDGEDIHFEVTTPGFSYFSLGGANGSGYKSLVKEEEVSITSIKEETVEPPKVDVPTPTETPEPDTGSPEEEEKDGICGPTVVVLLAMMVLLFKRKKI